MTEEEILEKYYDGRSVGENIHRGSAVSALASLIRGNTHDGALFKMHSDEFMKEHLLPEDYQYWLEQKGAFSAEKQRQKQE